MEVFTISSYTEVIYHYNRLCDAHNERCRLERGDAQGDVCPLEQLGDRYNGLSCSGLMIMHPGEFETAVMKWAAANPEPVYPTLIDVLVDQGAIPDRQSVYSTLYQQTPKEFAEKLGVQPLSAEGR